MGRRTASCAPSTRGFFATRQALRGGSACSLDGFGGNDIVGCATADERPFTATGCGPLTARQGNSCEGGASGWSCEGATFAEPLVVTHSGTVGKVLCCEDTRGGICETRTTAAIAVEADTTISFDQPTTALGRDDGLLVAPL